MDSTIPLFISLILLFSNAHRICITPDEATADIDPSCNITFSQVITNPDNYFTSDTTLVFLPGTHSINFTTSPSIPLWPPSTIINVSSIEWAGYHNIISRSAEDPDYVTQIIIADINNLILVGSERSPTIILCHGDLGFVFVHVKSLNISNLQFHHCGAEIPKIFLPPRQMFNAFSYSSIGKPLIILINSSSTHMTNVHIQDTSGPGLLGINVFGHSSISRSVFIRNNPNCVFIFLNTFKLLPLYPFPTPSFYLGLQRIIFLQEV